ncbi:flagellar basal body rod protein FlgF [Vogesella sp. LIG4]|uniref:flagellar basal body rod protein FlgF n=1 Tax=Vogesella sp. LIG4 TaxID=1192162 RepID=UPI00081FE3D6|nr:flagellar basal body rod protein FlgF [Vogesella sp. LIG4]SCK17616.1 flagellar basal-body rod protein FlgF [Vogesella sp. LIG4]
MDALIYTAMSGADRALHAQQVHANNLANVETAGFRADLEQAQAQQVPGYGYDSRHLALLQANTVNSAAGTLVQTGRDLDVAISGAGYFTVGYGGSEAYTRSGNFSVDAEGTLNLAGRPVMGDGGPIVLPPYQSMSIGQDGTVSIVPAGGGAAQQVDRLKLVNPPGASMHKNEAGLLVSRSGQTLDADDSVQVKGGYLERSNVSAVEEMLQTMNLNRDFEMQMRLFKAADSMADTGNRLIRS